MIVNIEKTSFQRGNQTYIDQIGHFVMGINLFNGTTYMQKNIVLKINVILLCEIPWFPWQPLGNFNKWSVRKVI